MTDAILEIKMDLQKRLALAFVAGFAIALLWAFPGRASQGGVVSGVVTDPSGAVVAGTDVLIQNSETALRKTVLTSGDGSYVFVGPHSRKL